MPVQTSVEQGIGTRAGLGIGDVAAVRTTRSTEVGCYKTPAFAIFSSLPSGSRSCLMIRRHPCQQEKNASSCEAVNAPHYLQIDETRLVQQDRDASIRRKNYRVARVTFGDWVEGEGLRLAAEGDLELGRAFDLVG